MPIGSRLWVSAVPVVASLTAIALAAGSSNALPAPVTLDGVGGVVPGVTPSAVEARWGVRINLSEAITPGCRTATISKGGIRGYALFERGRFGAVWFRRGAWTPSGIRIGSTLRQLKRTYGARLRFKPHAYDHGGWYAFLTRRASPRWRIRIDVSRFGRVAQIGFGGRAVGYIEGCA